MKESREFDVFLNEDMLVELREKGSVSIPKLHTDAVTGKTSSRYGYEGDRWYIPERACYYDNSQNIIVYKDGKARKKSGSVGIDIVAPCKFEECSGEKILASSMPKWGARTWAEIHKVNVPVRIQDLTTKDILEMGFSEVEGSFVIGNTRYLEVKDIKKAFQWWWNTTMGNWRIIKKGGLPKELHCYPYAEEDTVEGYDSRLPRKVISNPYVIVYHVKLIK